MKAKAEAEAAVSSGFGDANALIVKPDIIAGGPPGELRPPGPPGVPAGSVEAVASAAVAGALSPSGGEPDFTVTQLQQYIKYARSLAPPRSSPTPSQRRPQRRRAAHSGCARPCRRG